MLEFHDLPKFADSDQLTPDIFSAANVQLCAVNDSMLVSYVELPALVSVWFQ